MMKTFRRILKKIPASFRVLIVAVIGLIVFVGAHLMRIEQIQADVSYAERPDARRIQLKIKDETKILTANFDGPVPRMAERMREASGLALVLGYARLNEAINNRPAPANVDALLALVESEGMMPPGVSLPDPLNRKPGVLQSRHATIYIRYRVEPFGVEVLSIGNVKREDGASILIRLPSEQGQVEQPVNVPNQVDPGASLFTSDSTEAVTIPAPFSTPATMLSAGWQQGKFHSLDLSPERVNELNEWLRRYVSQ